MQSTTFFISSYLLLMAVAVIPIDGLSVEQRVACSENYAPCTCDQDTSGGWSVNCEQVPVTQVQDVFSRTTANDLVSFTLTIAPTETSSIPANLLGNSRGNKIYVNCGKSSYNLVINENAFSASKLLTKQFFINGCDLNQQPNFNFLSGFEALTFLDISYSKNFNSFQGIPSQYQLYYVAVINSRGFTNLADSPILLPSLRIFWLHGNEFDDVTAAKFLKIFSTSSTESMEELRLYDNKLTRVPEMVTSYRQLKHLMLERNAIQLLNSQSLAFSSQIGYLQLGGNSISSIEPNAFGSGNFQFVYMYLNKLTRLDSYIFQVMLERMVQNRGYLTLGQNPFDCDCHLAWLIVHKRNLLSVIQDGACSNSTSFNNLNPLAFRDCPVFTCPVGLDGNFPNPLSCSSFYICSAGTPYLLDCPAGLVYNPAHQICDWPYNVPTCNNL